MCSWPALWGLCLRALRRVRFYLDPSQLNVVRIFQKCPSRRGRGDGLCFDVWHSFGYLRSFNLADILGRWFVRGFGSVLFAWKWVFSWLPASNGPQMKVTRRGAFTQASSVWGGGSCPAKVLGPWPFAKKHTEPIRDPSCSRNSFKWERGCLKIIFVIFPQCFFLIFFYENDATFFW